jgi:alpha-ketoglutarate-dependent taurine dioxygenase
LEIGGHQHFFSPRLLRDLCSCPLCIDQSTRQKLFYSADIPADIQVTDSFLENDNYRLRWSTDAPGYGKDHVTSIPIQQLSRWIRTGVSEKPAPDLPARCYWDAATFEQQTQDFDFDAYMNDDQSLLKALRQLHIHGLLTIRGVPDDETSVERLAERIGPLKTTFYGKTWDVRSVPDAKNVAYTAQNLGFHMDLMYMQQPPHLQLLHCIRSSSAGGASLFTDSFKAVKDLVQDDLRSFLTLGNIPVDYHYDHAGSQYYHQRRPVIEQRTIHAGGRALPSYGMVYKFSKSAEKFEELTDPVRAKIASLEPMDFLESVAWSPPFQAPPRLADYTGPSSKNRTASNLLSHRYDQWHDAAQKFNSLIHRPDGIYERLMKPGECVIFDNRRVLHARKAFEVGDAGKERWLRGAYIDKDPYMSKLHVMGRQEMEA